MLDQHACNYRRQSPVGPQGEDKHNKQQRSWLTWIHGFIKENILLLRDSSTTCVVSVFVCVCMCVCLFVCVSWWVVGPHSCERECCLSHMFDEQIELQPGSGNVPRRFLHWQIWDTHTHTNEHTQLNVWCYLCVFESLSSYLCVHWKGSHLSWTKLILNASIIQSWNRCEHNSSYFKLCLLLVLIYSNIP